MTMSQSYKHASLVSFALSMCLLAGGCDDGPVVPQGSTGGTGGTTGGSAGAAGASGGAGGSGGQGGQGGASGSGGSMTSGGSGGSTSSGGASTTGSGGSMAVHHLDPNLAWYGDNRERLDALIDERGKSSPGYDAAKKPVAVFDWDNTVIKNDIGDATVFWLISHNKILQPPGKNWALTSPYLTPAAIAALGTACGSLALAGSPLPTSSNPACADEIVNIYYNGTTKGGAPGFIGGTARTIEPAYAWAAQLMGGRTPDDARSYADAAIADNFGAAEGAVQTIGTLAGLTAWIRVYDQIADLIGALQTNGFDVWVVSASPQYVVERFAAKVNVAADHVIGIRSVEAQGKLTYNLQGCGPIPDGTNDGAGDVTGNSLIPYIDGKRCWINKGIFGDNGPTALDKQMNPAKRQVFAAGDSNTDVTFVQDATAMKLVINRNKAELMCNAYRNYGGRWLINPMFIKPKGQYAAGYPCSTTGCSTDDGTKVPCLDEAGVTIPDQADNVY